MFITWFLIEHENVIGFFSIRGFKWGCQDILVSLCFLMRVVFVRGFLILVRAVLIVCFCVRGFELEWVKGYFLIWVRGRRLFKAIVMNLEKLLLLTFFIHADKPIVLSLNIHPNQSFFLRVYLLNILISKKAFYIFQELGTPANTRIR